jgi:hypothetical protein
MWEIDSLTGTWQAAVLAVEERPAWRMSDRLAAATKHGRETWKLQVDGEQQAVLTASMVALSLDEIQMRQRS